MGHSTPPRASTGFTRRSMVLALPMLIASTLVASCASNDVKKAYADADSNSRPVDITAVAKRSSVVVDMNCPRLVQPYRMSDNAVSVAKLAAQLAMTNTMSSLQTALGQQADQKTDIMATAKLAAKQLNWMPMSVERMYSEYKRKELETNILPRIKKWEKEYAIADKILDDVKGSIGEPHDYELKIIILKNPGTNAVAYPGGFLFIDRGLLKPQFRSKAYFAVAHETAHILQRHETKELESTAIDTAALGSDLLKLLEGTNVNGEAILALAAGSKGLFSKHFQDQELQADACATKMIMRIFPDPKLARKALWDFTNALGKLDPEPPAKVPTNTMERYALSLHVIVNSPFRRHPNTALRRQNIDQMYVQMSAAAGSGGSGASAAAGKPRAFEGAINKQN